MSKCANDCNHSSKLTHNPHNSQLKTHNSKLKTQNSNLTEGVFRTQLTTHKPAYFTVATPNRSKNSTPSSKGKPLNSAYELR